MAGKLQKYASKNRSLRADNRELSAALDELGSRHNPSVLRNFIGMGVKNGTAYGWTRLYVMLQQRGWAPKSVPLDVIGGTVIQSATAFFDGPISAFISDIGDGMAEGGFGRLATMHQLEQSEVAGNVCLIVPGGGAANGNGNASTGS